MGAHATQHLLPRRPTDTETVARGRRTRRSTDASCPAAATASLPKPQRSEGTFRRRSSSSVPAMITDNTKKPADRAIFAVIVFPPPENITMGVWPSTAFTFDAASRRYSLRNGEPAVSSRTENLDRSPDHYRADNHVFLHAQAAPIAPLPPGYTVDLGILLDVQWRRCWRDRLGPCPLLVI